MILTQFRKLHPEIPPESTIQIAEVYNYDQLAQLKHRKRELIKQYKPTYNTFKPAAKSPINNFMRKLAKLKQKYADVPEDKIDPFVKQAIAVLEH